MTGLEPGTEAVLHYSVGDHTNSWEIGVETIMDLGGCDRRSVTDPTELTAWAIQLTEKTGMETYGDPIVKEFGVGDLHGATVIQLITTSDVRIHAFPRYGGASLNFYSCGHYIAEDVIAFTAEFFGAQALTAWVITRAIPRSLG